MVYGETFLTENGWGGFFIAAFSLVGVHLRMDSTFKRYSTRMNPKLCLAADG